MRKSKLDKLIRSKKDENDLNYSIIDKAKDELNRRNGFQKSKRSSQASDEKTENVDES